MMRERVFLFRRLVCALLSVCILCAALPALAEEDGEDAFAEDADGNYTVDGEKVSGKDGDNAEGEDTEGEPDGNAVYREKTKEDFDLNSPAIYRGTITDRFSYSIFSEKDIKSPKLASNLKNVSVDILYVGLVWVIIRYDGKIGYIKREYLNRKIEPVDPVNTPPFAAQKHEWIATVAKPCYVRKTMTKEPLAEEELKTYWVKLDPGTRISIWRFQDGWAIVNYMRSYGYIDPNDLTDLIPVSPTDDPVDRNSPIAAYTSYYTMKHLNPNEKGVNKKMNKNRIINIGVGCKRIRESGLLMPGDKFNANKKNIGPCKRANGYVDAWGLVKGKSVPCTGGGTCQVCSTMYNVVMQLPGLKVELRNPHGYGGASYLPIHCDAAMGTDNQNLIFRNDYDFPVRLEGWSSGDGALLMLIYRAD